VLKNVGAANCMNKIQLSVKTKNRNKNQKQKHNLNSTQANLCRFSGIGSKIIQYPYEQQLC